MSCILYTCYRPTYLVYINRSIEILFYEFDQGPPPLPAFRRTNLFATKPPTNLFNLYLLSYHSAAK